MFLVCMGYILEYSECCLYIAVQTKVEGCNCVILCNYCVI